MEQIAALTTIDYSSLFIAVFSILIGIKAIVSIFEWIINKLGLETKWMRKIREEHELLIQTSKGLNSLQERYLEDMKRSDENDNEIRQDIKKLTNIFIEKEIDDMRWEILNFVSNLSSGVKYNREYFDHAFRTYKKYEKILNESHLENGLIEESMKYINEVYLENLKKGII